jgi:hypothetical protein
MLKRKFGKYLRSRTHTAMRNEPLCKFLCHNIVVLIHEMHELGVDPAFASTRIGNPFRPAWPFTLIICTRICCRSCRNFLDSCVQRFAQVTVVTCRVSPCTSVRVRVMTF